MNGLNVWMFLGLMALIAGCGDTSKSKKGGGAAGGEGQACFANNTCLAGLDCESGFCVDNGGNNNANNSSNNGTNNNTIVPNNNINNMPSSCGNGVIDLDEDCDGALLTRCVDVGFDSGTLGCIDCKFDYNGCTFESCGNGAIDAGESCDGTNVGATTCELLGYGPGTLRCAANCGDFDTRDCAPKCNNNRIEGNEVCDGTDVRETCADVGFGGGTLRCNATCDGYNTQSCMSLCGNGVVDAGEVCDGTNLPETCVSLGFSGGGTVRCSSDCKSFNTQACTVSNCGNGVINAGEQCDQNNLNSQTCSSRGFSGGTLSCNANCTFNLSGCSNLTCSALSGCPAPDAGACVCGGCFDNGVCDETEDCVCPDCTVDTTVCPVANCINNGVCDPFIESCACVDCAGHSRCQP